MNRITKIIFFMLLCHTTASLGQVNTVGVDSIQHTDSIQNKDSISATISLDEVLVLRKMVKHTVEKDVYTITSRIRERSYSALDVLKNLPGINLDNLTQQISVKMDNRVVILVDGLERPKEYVQSLTTEHVAKVEVLNVVPKKYSIAGIRYGVNIITKDITGYNINLQNLLMYSPGNNGNNDIANVQPHANYMYLSKKFKFNIGYGHANIHWNYPIIYERNITGKTNEISQNATTKTPNNFNIHKTNNVNLGLDYLCSPNNTLYSRTSFSNVKESQFDDISFYDMNSTNASLTRTEYFGNTNKYNDFKQTLGFNGKFNEKYSFAMDLNYNFRRNAINNVYRDPAGESNTAYINNKNFFQANLSLDYALSDQVSLNSGYTYMWNKYNSKQAENILSRNIFSRHDIFSYVDVALSENLSAHAGLNVERFTNKTMSQNANYTELLPTIQVLYAPQEWIQLAGYFDMQMIYPNQAQLSEIKYRMGNNIWSKGLSTLKPTKVTVSSLQLTLWDNLMLGVGYEFNKNNISYVYYQDASGINTTAVNNNLSKWGFMAMYDWQISQSLSFVNSINIDRIKLHYESDTKHFTNVIIDSKLDWFIKKLDFVASIEYSKNLARNPWVQGYNETEQDIWEISLRKSFLNKRLNLSLDYCPPIRLFVHDEQKKVINTPFYKETQRLNLHTYDNLLMFRVIFNLHKGVKGNIKDVNTKFINEEQKGRGLL